MRTITEYDHLERNIRSWVERQGSMMLVIGPPGTGKTRMYERIIAEVQEHNRRKSGVSVPLYHRLTGRLSALSCFRRLRDDPRSLIVFDDLVGLLADRHFASLLLQICESQPLREVSWNTGTHLLKDEEKFFICKSSVLVVLNELPRRNEGVLAVLDRLDGVRFVPSKREIIARARRIWPERADLISLVSELPTMPSLRTMLRAIEWADSPRLDVVEELLSECGTPRPIQQLFNIMISEPEAAWLSRYKQETGLGGRSYRRHKRIVKELIAARDSFQALGEGHGPHCEEQRTEEDGGQPA